MKIYADVTLATLTRKFISERGIEEAKERISLALDNYSPYCDRDGYERSLSLSYVADFSTDGGHSMEFYFCPVVGSMKLNGALILLTSSGDQITLMKDW